MFNDIVDMESNEKLSPLVIELFLGKIKLNILLVFYLIILFQSA